MYFHHRAETPAAATFIHYFLAPDLRLIWKVWILSPADTLLRFASASFSNWEATGRPLLSQGLGDCDYIVPFIFLVLLSSELLEAMQEARVKHFSSGEGKRQSHPTGLGSSGESCWKSMDRMLLAETFKMCQESIFSLVLRIYNYFIKIRVALCFGLNLWFSTYDLLKAGFPNSSEKQNSCALCQTGIFPLLSPSGCSWETLVLLFKSILCPGAHSPFPFTRQLFYPRDLGIQIINDPRLQLGCERTRRGPKLRQKRNKNVKNDEEWEF